MGTQYTRITTAGRFFEADVDELPAGEHFDILPEEAAPEYRAFEIHNIVHGAACEVELLVDPDDDGTYEVSVLLDTFTDEGISQGNEIEASEDDNMLVRITNTSSGPSDYVVTGREISQ